MTTLLVLLMLCTVEQVQAMPGINNLAKVPLAWLNSLIGAADSAVKRYCKRNLELAAYVEYYSGEEMPDVVLQETPVWCGNTTIAAASGGVSLPTSTINVVSTAGFHPGLAGNPTALPPTLGIKVGSGNSSPSTTVTYTGTTATSFTGCVGGTGTLTTGNQVSMPVAFTDANGRWGNGSGAFSPGTQMQFGDQFAPVLDRGGLRSNRGLLRKEGGPGPGFTGFYLQNFYSGKLSSWRKPCWPKGDGNIKVAYSAGYSAKDLATTNADLSYATAMVVAQMIRIQPLGQDLASENLGSYSYALQVLNTDPELGTVRRTLARYREIMAVRN